VELCILPWLLLTEKTSYTAFWDRLRSEETEWLMEVAEPEVAEPALEIAVLMPNPWPNAL